jgi:hypothetical protein
VARFKEKLFGRASDCCGVVWCGQFFLETGSSEGMPAAGKCSVDGHADGWMTPL